MDNIPATDQRITKHQRKEQRRRQKMENQQRQQNFRKRSTVLIWCVIFIIGVGAIYGLVKISLGSSTKTNAGKTVAPISSNDWTLGPAQAPITLIEYGDFQCPACGVYYPIVKQLLENNHDTIRFAFREYPLRTIHKNGDAAARAAEAAGTLGKFWPMYDQLYSEQDSWSDATDVMTIFQTYATALGLDATAWRTAAESSEVKQAIQDDIATGDAAGVDGTPSFYVNNQRVANPAGLDAFQKIVDDAKKNVVTAVQKNNNTASTPNSSP